MERHKFLPETFVMRSPEGNIGTCTFSGDAGYLVIYLNKMTGTASYFVTVEIARDTYFDLSYKLLAQSEE
jgi:hypothetical protein